MICPDCNGTGRVVLLVSAKPCKACAGTGRVPDKADYYIDMTPAVMYRRDVFQMADSNGWLHNYPCPAEKSVDGGKTWTWVETS